MYFLLVLRGTDVGSGCLIEEPGGECLYEFRIGESVRRHSSRTLFREKGESKGRRASGRFVGMWV